MQLDAAPARSPRPVRNPSGASIESVFTIARKRSLTGPTEDHPIPRILIQEIVNGLGEYQNPIRGGFATDEQARHGNAACAWGGTRLFSQEMTMSNRPHGETNWPIAAVGAALTVLGAGTFFFAIVGVFGFPTAILALLVFIAISILCARLPQH